MTVPICEPVLAPAGEPGRLLALHLVQVQCVDETEHEGFGPFKGEGLANDAMRLRVLNTVQVGSAEPQQCTSPVLDLGDNYQDNAVVPKDLELASVWLPEGAAFPVKVNSMFFLGEEDWGKANWDESTRTFVDSARTAIREPLVKAASTSIGGIIGSSAGPLGTIAGAAVGYVVGYVIDQLAVAAKDLETDMFPPNDATIILDSTEAPLTPDRPHTLTQRLPFAGQGGVYELTCEWRLYVQAADAPQPAAPTIDQLTLTVLTGGDDLRGGMDNLNVLVELADGRVDRLENVNRSQRWPDHTEQRVDLRLHYRVPKEQIRSIVLETTFRGGMGGDNWNLDALTVESPLGPVITTVRGAPFHRFTGDDTRLRVPV